MATESSIAALEVAVQRWRLLRAKVLADYWTLTKPEVNFLIVITTFAGFCLARPVESHHFPLMMLMRTLAGTLLFASGAGALNQFVERRFDAQLRRTARRPIVAPMNTSLQRAGRVSRFRKPERLAPKYL
jgi:protoheme IX farnesyltransferase